MRMPYVKSKRTKDPKLIEKIKRLDCAVCDHPKVDAHHWITKGAGGGDTLENLVPLCRICHQQFYLWGRETFLRQYPFTLERATRKKKRIERGEI